MDDHHGWRWTLRRGCISKYVIIRNIYIRNSVNARNCYIDQLFYLADGEPIVHKTFHCYTVRAKQGFAQNSRATGNHPKSAGASLRRYNKASLIQV